jgi:hypothetical protein
MKSSGFHSSFFAGGLASSALTLCDDRTTPKIATVNAPKNRLAAKNLCRIVVILQGVRPQSGRDGKSVKKEHE